jgi:hypothetical protein
MRGWGGPVRPSTPRPGLSPLEPDLMLLARGALMRMPRSGRCAHRPSTLVQADPSLVPHACLLAAEA